MRLFVTLAILENVDPVPANDPNALESALVSAVEVGGFTLLKMASARFSPQGATAAAIVGESHVAIHSWPEERRLFVDIASCSTRESVRRALEAILASFPGAKLSTVDEREIASGDSRP